MDMLGIYWKKLKGIAKECVRMVVKERVMNEYECLNEARSSIGGMRKNCICANLKFLVPCRENTILDGGIAPEAGEGGKGGAVVLSTDVNSADQPGNVWIDYIKDTLTTIAVRVKAAGNHGRSANSHGLTGWAIGHYFAGRYKAKNGRSYDESSLAVDVEGVSDGTMIQIAEDLCRSLSQESVLLRLRNGRILLIDSR